MTNLICKSIIGAFRIYDTREIGVSRERRTFFMPNPLRKREGSEKAGQLIIIK